jgi:predicted ATP-dependent serine protease
MLVGRSAELAQLEALLAGARRSRGAARLLLGEPGVGKTVLPDAAASLASDFVVLRATGVEAESDLGFSGNRSPARDSAAAGGGGRIRAGRRAARPRGSVRDL